MTDVLLQAVKVIAIDQNAQGADGKPVLARTATLEVNPIDAQKLALAQNVGSLSLVLRKPGEDQDLGRVATVSMNDLRYSYYGGAGAVPAAAANAASACDGCERSAPDRSPPGSRACRAAACHQQCRSGPGHHGQQL